MSPSRRTTRFLCGALAAAALSLTATASSPGDAAHAESGYRVCGYFNSAQSSPDGRPRLGTGLVTKVWKEGESTCFQKLRFMKAYYGAAYTGSSAEVRFDMWSCEAFGRGIGVGGWDPCSNFEVNKIYRYSSRHDLLHPVEFPGFQKWHD